MANFISSLFAANIISNTAYKQNESSTVVSKYNKTGNGVRLPAGAFKIINWFSTGVLQIGRTVDGSIYIERKSFDDANKVYCGYFDNSNDTPTLYCSVFDKKTKDYTDMDSNKARYVGACIYLVKLCEQDQDIKSKLNVYLGEISANVLHKSEYLEEVIDALYYSATDDEMANIPQDDIVSLSFAPDNMVNISADYNLELQNFDNCIASNQVEQVHEPVSMKYDSDFDALVAMKNMIEPTIKPYFDSLSEEQKALIPSENEIKGYVLTRDFIKIVKSILSGLTDKKFKRCNILLKGEPGTGKSKAARVLAYLFQMPYYMDQYSRYFDTEQLLGNTVAQDGKFNTNTNTSFRKAFTTGGIYIADDVNYCSPGISIIFNSVLEAPFTATTTTGEIIKRHPFSIMFLTCNPESSGAQKIADAVIDRCVSFDWLKIDDQSLAEQIVYHTGIKDLKLAKTMVSCMNRINEYLLNVAGEGKLIGHRQLMSWAETIVENAIPLNEIGNPNYVINPRYLNPVDCSDTILSTTGLPESTKKNIKSNVISPLFKGASVLNEFGV